MQWFKEKYLKMQPYSSKLPIFPHDYLKISLNDFNIVVRK